jgi:hypothetical protein
MPSAQVANARPVKPAHYELRPLVRTDPLAPYASAIGKLAQSEARELTQRARMRPLGADVEARLGGLAEHP